MPREKKDIKMNTTRLLAAAALLSCASAAPALAAWDRLGSVDINFRMDRDVQSVRFGGPMERFSFRAERSDINCRSIRATFENGRTREIFSGRIRRGSDVTVDLPGNARNVRNLQFACGAEMRQGGIIQISADIGRYQNDWRRSPDWNRQWSRMFNWGSNAVNNWQPLSTVHFEGRGDTEATFAGFRGVRVDNIALMPVETNARCARVSVRFQNNRVANLNVNNGDVLRRGQYYALDLPGGDRNIREINMRCHAEDGNNVTMRIFVSH
jgi:hypothetical protein